MEGWNLNATRGIKFYVDWVEMVIYGQTKITCNKDDEVNILSHLPGVYGKKWVCKYQKYLNTTAWSYPREDEKVNIHTPPPSDPSSVWSRSSALNGQWCPQLWSSASNNVVLFYTNKSPRSSNTIIHQVTILLINHLLSHKFIKQEQKLLVSNAILWISTENRKYHDFY